MENQNKLGSQVRGNARSVLSSYRSRVRGESLDSLESVFQVEMNNYDSRKVQGDESNSTEHMMSIERDPEAALPQGQQPRGFDGIKVEHTVMMEAIVSPRENLDAERGVFNWVSCL